MVSRCIVLGSLLLAACGGKPEPITADQVKAYQANMETACRRKAESDPRVDKAAAAPFCACVMAAYRKDVQPAEWETAVRAAASGRSAEELKVFQPYESRMEACANQVLKPAAGKG